MKRLTRLLGLEIENLEGKKLGHVFDFRSRREPEAGAPNEHRRIDELVYGLPGLLERLGAKQAEHKILAWKHVVEIQSNKIVVDLATPIRQKWRWFRP